MTPSKNCLDLIRQFEGCKLEAYLDPRPNNKIWTVGFGCTGANIGPGTKWTQEQADGELMIRVEAIGRVLTHKIVPIITQNQMDALCSLVFNIGMGAFGGSTLLKCINERKWKEAADQFLRWDKAAGQVLAGLMRRRKAERELFLREN